MPDPIVPDPSLIRTSAERDDEPSSEGAALSGPFYPEAMGVFLGKLLAPEQQDGPPYVHTFRPPEPEYDEDGNLYWPLTPTHTVTTAGWYEVGTQPAAGLPEGSTTQITFDATPMNGTLCFRKCSDIPDLEFLRAIDECLRRIPHPADWAMRWNVRAVLAGHPKAVGTPDASQDWPGVPENLVLAKARKLIRRGLMSGCACGCRGDFEVTAKGRALQRAAKEITV